MTQSPPPRGDAPFTYDPVIDHFAQWQSTRPKKGKTPPFLINEVLLIDEIIPSPWPRVL